jgi:recombinational DNA repair protein RecT
MSSPWFTHENEMRKKTVFRRHSKWQPFSTEVQEAINYGEDEEFPKKGFETAKPVFSAGPKTDLSFLTSGNIGGDEIGDQKSEQEKLSATVATNDDPEGIGHDE